MKERDDVNGIPRYNKNHDSNARRVFFGPGGNCCGTAAILAVRVRISALMRGTTGGACSAYQSTASRKSARAAGVSMTRRIYG
jgi:hypothetical protein